MNPEKMTISIAAGVMLLGTLLGAFGAHGLKSMLEGSGHLDSWQTAVLYQLIHGLAILAAGIWLRMEPREKLPPTLLLSAMLWTAGILFFSGSLYVLSLNGPRWLGPVTPLGGLCFLAGWLTLGIGVLRNSPRGDSRE